MLKQGINPSGSFPCITGGRHVTKPLIQFTLEELFKDDLIQEVIIVGHKALLEDKLLPLLKEQTKPWKIIGQSDPIGPEIMERFHIKPGTVPHDSVGGNLIKGYAASRALRRKEGCFDSGLRLPNDEPEFHKQFYKRGPSDTG